MKLSALFLTIASLASVQASLPVPQNQFGPSVDNSTRTEAVITGLDSSPSSELTPVLVELSNLPLRAAVWVQVQRVDVESASLPVTVKSEFFLRKGTNGILTVPGLTQICEREGAWTVEVLMSDGRGNTVLASKTIRRGAPAPMVVQCLCDCRK